MTVSQATLPWNTVTVERLGVVMRQDDDDPHEAWGVLNPACARTREDELLLFPRIVADGNYSRVGVARVLFDAQGVPTGVERLGVALEPEAWYERNPRTGGVEDPRITWVSELDAYVMSYCGFGPRGPRVALAMSRDLHSWTRSGLARLAPELGVEWSFFDNKDGYVLPHPVTAPDGSRALALVHRPVFQVPFSWQSSEGGASEMDVLPETATDTRPGMWISYLPLDRVGDRFGELGEWSMHRELLTPAADWEILKVGGGTNALPLAGCLVSLYHGVRGALEQGVDHQQKVHYCAGLLVLDGEDPSRVLYRSPEPLLAPEGADETTGIVDNVVFPTALDDRGGGVFDVYYGMADARIGVARMDCSAVIAAS